MKIFPAIDIKDKKCVRLVKGDFDNKTIEKIPSKYKGLLEECLPHYNYLYSFKK